MDEMQSLLKTELEEDPEVEGLADEIREGLTKSFTDSLADENSENDLFNVLLDDDNLLEELMDRVAALNVLEAASGGSLQKSYAGEPIQEVTGEELEGAYLSVLDTLFELSKTVNPLYGVGLDRLNTGLSIVREFERLYWPLSTRVTEENIRAFQSLLPEEPYEDVLSGNKRAIGALRLKGDRVYAAGVIVYGLPRDNKTDRPEITLDWIMVSEDFPEMGVGNFLMAELLELSLQNEGTAIRVTLPMEQFETKEEAEEAGVLYQFLDEWGFAFSVTEGIGFVSRISELEENRMLQMPYNMAEPLAELGSEGPALLSDFFGRLKEPERPELSDLPYSFFDQNLSCVIRKEGRIESVLLLHSYPSGNVRYEGLLCTGKRDTPDVMDLLCFACQERKARISADAMVYGEFISSDGMKLAPKLMPKARCPMYYNGLLMSDEKAFTTEEWEELRKQAGLNGDMIPEDGMGDED